MNIKRFYAATAREALAKARMTFGDGTLILSNRPTPDGVEVVATAEESLSSSLERADDLPLSAPAPAPEAFKEAFKPAPQPAARPQASPAHTASVSERNPVHEDTEQLAMSTLSFQDYVRERMLRRRHEALQGNAPAEAQQPLRRDPRETRAPLAPLGQPAPLYAAPEYAHEHHHPATTMHQPALQVRRDPAPALMPSAMASQAAAMWTPARCWLTIFTVEPTPARSPNW